MTIVLIQNTNSLDSLSVSHGNNTNLIFFIFVLIFFLSFVIWSLRALNISKRKKQSQSSDGETKKTKPSSPKDGNSPMVVTEPVKGSKKLKKPKISSADSEKKTKSHEPESFTSQEPLIVQPEMEEQSHPKYIGYNPTNIFEQTEPFNFPYVLMPKPGSIIKFPRKGRTRRKGFKEEDFKNYLTQYFINTFQIFDDRFILVKNNPKPYEPDFTFVDEKKGLNIFLDIEIDEPYEGINDM